ncbi:MAG TPA: hypothetical protein VKE96_25400 [Vicinamibacterales bacterium]|nr:hypothetical protein [Vicinamibacterales bacterium]
MALDERHRDVLDAVDFVDVVNADHVLVGDLASEQQLVLEALLRLGRGRSLSLVSADQFQRDCDIQLRVPRLVDGTHPADAKQLDDVIPRAERLAHAKWTDGRARIGRRHAHPGRRLHPRSRSLRQAGRRAKGRARRETGRVDRDHPRRDAGPRERDAA